MRSYYTTAEAAKLLGIKVESCKRQCYRGAIKAVKNEWGRWEVDRADIQARVKRKKKKRRTSNSSA